MKKLILALVAVFAMAFSMPSSAQLDGEFDEFQWPEHDVGNTWGCLSMYGSCSNSINMGLLPGHHQTLCGGDSSCVSVHIYRDSANNRYWHYRARESWAAPNGVLIEELTPEMGAPMHPDCYYTGGVITCP